MSSVKKSEKLIEACRVGDFNQATVHLQQNADPTGRGEDDFPMHYHHMTPLHYGCIHGKIEFVKLLVETYRCDPEVRNSYEMTPLHYSSKYGHLDIVQYLISEQGCNPEIKDGYQMTPLHYSCECNHLNIVQYLINEQGCNPWGVNHVGLTPICHAYSQNNMEIVQFIMRQQMFDPYTNIDEHNTLLHCACRDGHFNIVQYLLNEQGCNPEIREKSYQRTPLHYACQHGHLDIVQYLISEQNCNVEVRDERHWTPLHYACWHFQSNIVWYLIIERGCTANLQEMMHFTLNHSIHPAKKQQLHMLKVIKILIEGGCNPDQPDSNGNTALHIACGRYYLHLVKFLISEGKCNPQLPDQSGNTALHRACNAYIPMDDLSMVKVLINEGKCNPDVPNNDGDTALHIACKNTRNCISLVKFLLKEGNSNPKLRNKNGQTPLELTTDPEKTKELIRHGADPTNVYKLYSKAIGTKQPLQPPVKVFVVGNPSAGKSTLTAALKKEKSFLARTLTPSTKVSGVDENTVGVIPCDHVSKTCGHITFYDFAGQPEFYSSHAALLQNAIQTSPPIFLLVVDLCKSEEEIKQTILYWLSFLENQCTSVSGKPHVIAVGSHVDILRARGEDPNQKMILLDTLLQSLSSDNFHVNGFVALDCQYSESAGISQLREHLKNSCEILRKQESISFNSHCFFVYLMDTFKDSVAVTIEQLRKTIHEGTSYRSATDREPINFLPLNLSALCTLCDELNDRGHILFLKDPVSIENSWVIIDKTTLLSEVTGTIFAPEGFKQHCKLASSTGVVPVCNLVKTFPQHNLEMLIGFLTRLEFCHEITDQEVFQLATQQHRTTLDEAESSSRNEQRYLLFPALIALDVSSKVWETKSEFRVHSGWTLTCYQHDQFFTSRFLHVLLLRLAFNYTFPQNQTSKEFPTLLRKCSLWKNGIYWGNRDRVETLVEVVEQNKAVIVLMRCPELTYEFLQFRSSVIQKVLAAASEFCGKVDTMESFIDPSEIIKYPLKPTSQLTLVSLTEIAEAVADSKSAVVSGAGQPLSLDDLVSFEPFAHLEKRILHQLFSTEHSSITVTDRSLSQIDKKSEIMVKLLKGFEGTYQCLREKLNELSVFAGRNPLELAGVSTDSLLLDQSTDDTIQTHPGHLSLTDLSTVRRAIWDVREKWYDLGIDLGIPVTTLKVIERDNHFKVESCFTAVLEEWLKAKPTWSSLVEALKSPPVDYPQLAEEVLTKYVMDTSTPGN